eukprot:15353839-Ditylum_brightwellii.AAC.1
MEVINSRTFLLINIILVIIQFIQSKKEDSQHREKIPLSPASSSHTSSTFSSLVKTGEVAHICQSDGEG